MIRELDPTSEAEILCVALRMQETLVEVLGAEVGGTMYSLEWLVERVKFHISPTAQVFLAADEAGHLTGHTIVRAEVEDGQPIGLFSTTYVEPDARRRDVAKQLLTQGEAWMRARALPIAVTYTDEANEKLQRLYQGLGYTQAPAPDHFVRLSKSL